MNTEAILKGNILHDITHWGIRASIGITFIIHSLKKFDPSWQEWLIKIGVPPEMQLPIALAEFIGGVLLIAGVLTRITGVVFAAILLGAIFHIRWEKGFFCFQWRMGMGSDNACRSSSNYCSRSRKNLNFTPSKENSQNLTMIIVFFYLAL